MQGNKTANRHTGPVGARPQGGNQHCGTCAGHPRHQHPACPISMGSIGCASGPSPPPLTLSPHSAASSEPYSQQTHIPHARTHIYIQNTHTHPWISGSDVNSFCCYGLVYLLDSWESLRSLIEAHLHVHLHTKHTCTRMPCQPVPS